MDFFDFAKIVMCAVLVLAPICIYIMIKYGDNESARRRFRKHHRFLLKDDETDRNA